MTNLEPSEKAGPEEVGFSSPANQVEAKEQPEACQRGREPKNAEHLHQTSPNGRTRCRMRNKLHRRSPAAELGANLRKATSNRPGHSAPSGGPQPDSMLDAGPRLESADIASESRPLGALLLPFGES